ncbi:hypothetical protein [Agrobacterium pusense]|uniref:hypothetical protein n=1 Tax=Agrobacterium pusense TaxID=648995 RepID=UPI0022B85D20|nr:hypothetical protein [Agrobacterium pusense]MCZ7927840.1 hypothetical protein [Agrobacterium pusense]
MQKLGWMGRPLRPPGGMARCIGENSFRQGHRRLQHDQDLVAKSRIDPSLLLQIEAFEEKLP